MWPASIRRIPLPFRTAHWKRFLKDGLSFVLMGAGQAATTDAVFCRRVVLRRPWVSRAVGDMSSSVSSLISTTDATYGGAVQWGNPVPTTDSGVYLISTAPDPDTVIVNPPATAPISDNGVALLLETRPELRLNGRRPHVEDLVTRLAGMWLADECVVYVGKATSLKQRVRQYYSTPLGARSPHAGGWPLKALADIGSLWVHWGTSTRPELAEQYMLARFVDHVSDRSKSTHIDPQRCFPYANLEGPGGQKKHGITGAREPRSPSDAR